jgi:hypothetical protein
MVQGRDSYKCLGQKKGPGLCKETGGKGGCSRVRNEGVNWFSQNALVHAADGDAIADLRLPRHVPPVH